MSLFQFLASDKVLDEVENQYLEIISINEAIKRNIEISDFIFNDTKIDRDKKIIMFCDSEDHLDELVISNEMYYSSEYARRYTNKKYFSQLEWRYTKSRAIQFILYLKKQLKDLEEIEIWSIWLDDKESASKRAIDITELSIKDLKSLDISNGYAKAECIVVKK